MNSRLASHLLVALALILTSTPASGVEGQPSLMGKLKAGPLSPLEQKQLKQCRQVWHGRRDGVFANRFLGIETLQNPLDVWITQEILSEVKPDFVIETGTYHGGSALLWAMYLEQINPSGRIITVDIEDQREPAAVTHRLAKKVDFLEGSSSGEKIVDEVKAKVGDKSAVVILDSYHGTDHVLSELEAYAPFVPVGSYIIVQDTALGPGKAVQLFLAKNDDFVLDKKRERLLISNNVGGFLKRVK